MGHIFGRNAVQEKEELEEERPAAAQQRIAGILQKTITITPDKGTMIWLDERAHKERRTVSNMTQVLVEQAVDFLRKGGKLEPTEALFLPFIESQANDPAGS